jgi:glycerol-3-phosphate dehydrogenase (NAD(P)+)
MAAVTVLGAGSQGTALAIHLARISHEVTLWARNGEFATKLRRGENTVYLPGAPFPSNPRVEGSLDDACAEAAALVFVCPSSGIRALGEAVRSVVRGQPTLVSAAKGVEHETRMTMSAILEDVLGEPITEEMYKLLYENKAPRQVVIDLMTRGLKREVD